MTVGSGNNQRDSAARRAVSALVRTAWAIWIAATALGTGCGETKLAQPQPVASAEPNDKVAAAILRVLAADKAARAAAASQPSPPQIAEQAPPADAVTEADREGLAGSPYFSWTAAEEHGANSESVADDSDAAIVDVAETEVETTTPTEVVAPEAEEVATVAVEAVEVEAEYVAMVAPAAEEVAAVEAELEAPSTYVSTPFAVLLPPQMVAAAEEVRLNEPVLRAPTANEQPEGVELPDPKTPEIDGLSESERQLVEQVIRETSPAGTGMLTDSRVNEMATQRIREANALASRGAHYAAREKLIEVLRMISQAKDTHSNDSSHSAALAAGLRALDEAEDFAPQGTQLEAEVEVPLVVAAHRTPIARRLKVDQAQPRQMMDLYLRYAQVKLGNAVSGEPAGSMALYALGKITSQMGQSQAERNRVSHRQAVAFQQAALMAHNQNYFAAHELAVLMAESGRLAEAEGLLKQVAAREPSPTVYRNLAHVQQRMGRTELASSNRALATQMAAQQAGVGQVRWVGTDAFGRSPITPTHYAGPTPQPPMGPPAGQRTALAPPPRAPQTQAPVPPGSWR